LSQFDNRPEGRFTGANLVTVVS